MADATNGDNLPATTAQDAHSVPWWAWLLIGLAVLYMLGARWLVAVDDDGKPVAGMPIADTKPKRGRPKKEGPAGDDRPAKGSAAMKERMAGLRRARDAKRAAAKA